MNETTTAVATPTPKAKKAANNGKADRELRPLQIKVLKLLAKGKPLDRAKMYDALGFSAHSGLNDVLGKNDPKARAKMDKEKYMSLISLGYIKLIPAITGPDEDVHTPIMYVITASGRKALEKVK